MSEWISFKNRVPSSDTDSESARYIVYGKRACGSCDDNLRVMECTWRRMAKEFEWGEYRCLVEALYWMPLPKLPEVKYD